MARSSHPKKDVEEALKHAEANGWRVEQGGSHAWGKFTVPTTTMSAVVASSASPAFGVPRKIRGTMPAL